MKLRTWKYHTVVSHLIRMAGTKKGGDVRVWLYPDGRLANGWIWLQLPQKAVKNALDKRDKGKLRFQTEGRPDLNGLINGYQAGTGRTVAFKRFYFGTDTVTPHKYYGPCDGYPWQAEFTVPGQLKPLKVNADYVRALEYAGAEYWKLRDNPSLGNQWLEGWNDSQLIGAVMPIEEA